MILLEKYNNTQTFAMTLDDGVEHFKSILTISPGTNPLLFNVAFASTSTERQNNVMAVMDALRTKGS